MRDLVLKAIGMANEGKSPLEIRAFLEKGALALGQTAGSGTDEAYEIRLVRTGEIISYGKTGYAYRPR
jgi:hypothetical protein